MNRGAGIVFRVRCSPESPRTRDRSDSEFIAESLYDEELQVRMSVPAGWVDVNTIET